MILFYFLMIIPIMILLTFMPYLTNKNECFGVSIPSQIHNTSQIKRLKNKFIAYSTIMNVVLLSIYLISSKLVTSIYRIDIIFASFISIYLIIYFIIYIFFYKRMKSIKNNSDWQSDAQKKVVIDTSFRNNKLIYSNMWFIPSFLIILLTIYLSIKYYSQLPNNLLINYDLSGLTKNDLVKSKKTIFFTPTTQLFLTILFIIINTTIHSAKQQINYNSPKDSIKRSIIFRRSWSLYLIFMNTLMMIMLGLFQTYSLFNLSKKTVQIIPFYFSGAMMIGLLILVFRLGQGGSRLKTGVVQNTNNTLSDADKFWKLGMFYYNKNDPTLFLEKRFGIGWTINFARPLAWIIIVSTILIAISLPYFYN